MLLTVESFSRVLFNIVWGEGGGVFRGDTCHARPVGRELGSEKLDTAKQTVCKEVTCHWRTLCVQASDLPLTNTLGASDWSLTNSPCASDWLATNEHSVCDLVATDEQSVCKQMSWKCHDFFLSVCALCDLDEFSRILCGGTRLWEIAELLPQLMAFTNCEWWEIHLKTVHTLRFQSSCGCDEAVNVFFWRKSENCERGVALDVLWVEVNWKWLKLKCFPKRRL